MSQNQVKREEFDSNYSLSLLYLQHNGDVLQFLIILSTDFYMRFKYCARTISKLKIVLKTFFFAVSQSERPVLQDSVRAQKKKAAAS